MNSLSHISGTAGPSRIRRNAWVFAAVSGALCVVAWLFLIPYATGYGDERATLFTWLRRHWARPDWQHGALVPLIIGWLVYRRRKTLTSIPSEPSRWGLVLLLFSLLVLWVGYKANSYYFGYAGIHLLIGAMILWLAGGWHFRALLFPWIFLAFAWPLIFLEDSLAFQLRLLVSEISEGFLNLIGVDTLRSGTALVSAPDAAAGLAAGEKFHLGVDGPCSGMRSLFALLMVSALYGYLTLEKNGKRLVFFALAIPMAILGNFARIMILLVGVRTLGSETAIGSPDDDVSAYHLMAGIAVFVIALGGMVLLARFMKRGEPKRARVGTDSKTVRSQSNFGWPRGAVAMGLCALGITLCLLAPAPTKGDSAGVVMQLPRAVGDFIGVEGKPAEIEKTLLPDDTQFAKMTYRRGHVTSTPDVVHCSIVLSGSDRRSIHRPEVCLTGQGWTVDAREVIPVTMPNGQTLEVMDLLVSRTSENGSGDPVKIRAHYLYWFVGKDVTTPSHFRRILLTSWDNIFRNVNHRWAYPSVMALITENIEGAPERDSDETQEMLVGLIRDLAPAFQNGLSPAPLTRLAGNP